MPQKQPMERSLKLCSNAMYIGLALEVFVTSRLPNLKKFIVLLTPFIEFTFCSTVVKAFVTHFNIAAMVLFSEIGLKMAKE